MEKILKLDVRYVEGDYEEVRIEEISDKDNDINFSVCNLDECPGDAVIGGGLFDANDYIRALNQGIELAKKGYTKVELGNLIKMEE